MDMSQDNHRERERETHERSHTHTHTLSLSTSLALTFCARFLVAVFGAVVFVVCAISAARAVVLAHKVGRLSGNAEARANTHFTS